jgi:hypothetical protein
MRRGAGLRLLVLLAAASCGPTDPTPTPSACPPATSAYAKAVVESWIPACSLAQNAYDDPLEALGAPNAASATGGYTGFVSLGFGGHVTLDLGGCVADQAGNDIRVYQAVSSEPVSVYVATSATGPFTLLRPFFQDCGTRFDSTVRRYCDFDLASASVREARYVRVEDGEIYPCPGGTESEGADLDAVQALGVPAP